VSNKDDWIRLPVKYKGKCAQCRKDIQQGEYALWSRSSKAIRHVNCEVQETGNGEMQLIKELDCFICGRPAGCTQCGFEGICDRAVVSQACICNQCFCDNNAFNNYQHAFRVKMQKAAKVKI
jgi:hypothetical protein